MNFAYADPPYLGCSHLYPEHPEASRYDDPEEHGELMAWMDESGLYDGGWAISLSMPSLRAILPLAPEGARVAAWVKGWCSWKPGNRVAYAWEPIIWKSNRTRKDHPWTTRDWVMCNVTTGRTVKGAKPDQFCSWLFGLLGMQPGDHLHDLFPGSGAVGAAWARYSAQPELALLAADAKPADADSRGDQESV